jgi:hypothetical protein
MASMKKIFISLIGLLFLFLIFGCTQNNSQLDTTSKELAQKAINEIKTSATNFASEQKGTTQIDQIITKASQTQLEEMEFFETKLAASGTDRSGAVENLAILSVLPMTLLSHAIALVKISKIPDLNTNQLVTQEEAIKLQGISKETITINGSLFLNKIEKAINEIKDYPDNIKRDAEKRTATVLTEYIKFKQEKMNQAIVENDYQKQLIEGYAIEALNTAYGMK